MKTEAWDVKASHYPTDQDEPADNAYPPRRPVSIQSPSVTILVAAEAKPLSKRGLAALCASYILVMLYSSTVIGPNGPHFVYQDPTEAFRRFLSTRFVAHGSDQRADWIGNLLMLVPFGFLAAGTVWPRRRWLRLPAAVLAIVVCLITILAIKYLQLFFPPRTVTLNYIAAQGLGSIIGCVAFAVWRERIGASIGRPDAVAALVLILRLYCAALLIFVLMPLDFALNASDLWIQVQRLPDTILAIPGENRPFAIRAMVIAVASAAFIPVGMMLTVVRNGTYRVRRGLRSVTALGLCITTGVFLLSTLVIGATPIMASILYRAAGIVAGAAILRWLTRQNPAGLRKTLGRLVPWLVPLYLLALLLVNRLISRHWLTPDEAQAQAYKLGLIPLFDYYIVSKAAAAKNIVAHALAFMPIGAGLWLRDPRQRPGLAFTLAAMLSFGLELARYFRPGLEGDINAVVVGGLGAVLAMRMMPVLWSMLETLSLRPAATEIRQRDRSPHAFSAASHSAGEIEHF